MNKKIFCLVLAIFAVLPNYNYACADDGDDDVPGGIIFTPIPHRSNGNNNWPAAFVLYNEQMETVEISFTEVLHNVTIRAYYEGMLIDTVTIGATSNGYIETIDLNHGEGYYRIVIETNGQTIYNNGYEFEY